jgi:PadR family transcriptional regulator AphA
VTTPRGNDAPLSLAEQVCLALVVEGVSHGWAIGSLLARGGDLGRIWSLSRPLTYRAIDSLVERALVTRAGVEAGRGRDRSVLAATTRGRRASAAWLDEPVVHLRDIRTELLLKLSLRQRRHLATAPLLEAQIAALEPAVESLVAQPTETDLIARWRSESAAAARRFLEGALAAERP